MSLSISTVKLKPKHVVHRRTHYAYRDLLKRGAGVDIGEYVGKRMVPDKKRPVNRKNRNSIASILKSRRKAGEYHRGL